MRDTWTKLGVWGCGEVGGREEREGAGFGWGGRREWLGENADNCN